jgi:hypothetical protein
MSHIRAPGTCISHRSLFEGVVIVEKQLSLMARLGFAPPETGRVSSSAYSNIRMFRTLRPMGESLYVLVAFIEDGVSLGLVAGGWCWRWYSVGRLVAVALNGCRAIT